MVPKKAPRSFCFCSVFGGYLDKLISIQHHNATPSYVPLNGARVSLEPVGDEDLVLLFVAEGEDIGTLNGLVEVAENVVDDDNGLGCVGRAGHVWREFKLVHGNWVRSWQTDRCGILQCPRRFPFSCIPWRRLGECCSKRHYGLTWQASTRTWWQVVVDGIGESDERYQLAER